MFLDSLLLTIVLLMLAASCGSGIALVAKAYGIPQKILGVLMVLISTAAAILLLLQIRA
jgi:hypothetical protein